MRLLSRKFLVTLVGLGAGTYLSMTGKLDTASATLIVGLATAYVTANVTQDRVLK